MITVLGIIGAFTVIAVAFGLLGAYMIVEQAESYGSLEDEE